MGINRLCLKFIFSEMIFKILVNNIKYLKMEIKRFFKKSLLPPPQFYEVEEQKLEFIYQYMYDNDPACEYLFDREMKENPKQDINDLMADIVDRMIVKHEHTRNCVQTASDRYRILDDRRIKREKKKLYTKGQAKGLRRDLPQLWLLTFTLHPNDKEKDLKPRVIKSLKKYKYMYVEEHGTDSGRYHIHAIVETDDPRGFENGYNLKPTANHQGRIDRKRYLYNNDDGGKYLSKETKILGDVEYIQNLIRLLPSKKI